MVGSSAQCTSMTRAQSGAERTVQVLRGRSTGRIVGTVPPSTTWLTIGTHNSPLSCAPVRRLHWSARLTLRRFCGCKQDTDEVAMMQAYAARIGQPKLSTSATMALLKQTISNNTEGCQTQDWPQNNMALKSGVATGSGGPTRTAALSSHLVTPLSDDLTVRVRNGTLQGVAVGVRSRAFKAIPYAAPPLGALRWQPPRQPEAWMGVRNASAFGPGCESSEDCLQLNVFAPRVAKSSRKRLPVMLFIHGGCWKSGSSSLYDGTDIVDFLGDVIVVTINCKCNSHALVAAGRLSDGCL